MSTGIGTPLFPLRASVIAGRVDTLVLFMLALTGLVTFVVAFLIIYFAFRYRRRPGDPLPPQIAGSIPLELAWTLIPMALFLIPFVWGARLYAEMYTPPPNALTITVVGKQWMWRVYHPGGQRELNELHLPVGRPVKLLMTSEDVIHSFFVPAFRSKQDVLPGRYTEVTFQPTAVGRYHVFCSEYCGTEHSHMRGWVVVMTPGDYERWLEQGASESAASQGAKLVQQYGCFTCHRDDSLRRAPVLAGLFGQPVQLSDGRTVIADEDYIRESILDPTAKVVLGFQPIMPSFRGRLSEEQMMDIIAYLKSIGPGTGRPPVGNVPPEGQPLFPASTGG